ncbi:MAG: hypothetical protein PHV51_00570 [Methanosarcinaceae archaeon]|nr:hypothetical protein [Methanosarcinaceae archaeon]
MSKPRFSTDYRNYGEWLKAQLREKKYEKEIIRMYQYSPYKSLNQLRKLIIRDYDFSVRSWNSLSAQEKIDRNLSFQIFREISKEDYPSRINEKLEEKKDFAVSRKINLLFVVNVEKIIPALLKCILLIIEAMD